MKNRFFKAYKLLSNKDRSRLIILFLLMIIAALIEIVAVAAIPFLVATLSSPQVILDNSELDNLFEILGITDSHSLLVLAAIVVTVAFILKNLFLIAYKYLASSYVFSIYTTIGDKLFNAYLKTSYEFFLNRNTSELLRNVTQDTHLFTLKVVFPFLKLVMDAFVVIGIIVLFLYADPLLTLMTSGILGGSALLLMYGLKSSISKYGKQEQTYRAKVIQTVNEAFAGIREIRVAGKIDYFRFNFLNKLKNTAHAYRFKEFIGQAIVPGIETIAVLGLVILTLIMTYQGKSLESIIPVLALFIAGTARLMPAIKKVVHHFTVISYHSYVIDSVSNDLTRALSKPELSDIPSSKEIQVSFEKNIRFENVSYSYPDTSENVIHKLNFSVQKGTFFAISGMSGSGKSTLVQLLLGFLRPQQGKIAFDDFDIHEHLTIWRGLSAYIPQEIFLMDGSILENITFGDNLIQDDFNRLNDVLKLTQLTDWIQSLPDGLQTKTGERGLRISGGQRQRIGLARALYQQPKILILDEATSALDSTTEEAFISQLLEIKGDMTIIMITHKKSLFKYADEVLLMEEYISS